MRITNELTDDAVLAEFGARLARTRLERNLTQAQLAGEAGVGRATVERIELGHGANLGSFVRVSRVLGLLDTWEQLVPEPVSSPLERLRLQGKQRRRAAGAHGRRHPIEDAGPWSWGDEVADGPG
jgi:transcriptional regulator with XRE-family HTH domain